MLDELIRNSEQNLDPTLARTHHYQLYQTLHLEVENFQVFYVFTFVIYKFNLFQFSSFSRDSYWLRRSNIGDLRQLRIASMLSTITITMYKQKNISVVVRKLSVCTKIPAMVGPTKLPNENADNQTPKK